MKENATCLVPDCTEKQELRGLCRAHYTTAYGRVHRKLTTWAKLIKLGLALPQQKRGAKPNTDAFGV